MATVAEVATDFQARQISLADRTATAIVGLWRGVNPVSMSASWGIVAARAAVLVQRAQFVMAANVDPYVENVAEAFGAASLTEAALRPQGFAAGFTDDGRSMNGLLLTGPVNAKRSIAGGASLAAAMDAGAAALRTAVESQIAGAGSAASMVSMFMRDAPAPASAEPFKGPGGHMYVSGSDGLVKPYFRPKSYVRMVQAGACSRCIILAGEKYGKQTPFARHPRCFPAGTIVAGPGLLGATRRWYEGELTTLTTASGENLSLTGNHPVLTRRGWVPANLIEEGDYVFRSAGTEVAHALMVPDHDQVPSRIEDVWRSFSMAGLETVPTSAEYFHGDGQGGEIDIVRADGSLRRDIQSVLSAEHGVELGLSLGLGHSIELNPQGAAELFYGGHLSLAGSLISGTHLELPLILGHRGISRDLGLASGSPFNSGFRKASGDHISPDSILSGEGIFAGARLIGGDDVTNGDLYGLPRWDAPDGPLTVENSGRYASLGIDLANRLTSQVEADRVIKLVRAEFADHVYSLDSSEGWHSANNLIVSNCHCTHIPVDENVDDYPATDPKAYYEALSPDARIKAFGKAGVEAIDAGADMNQVVNARQGMYVTKTGEQATRMGTTKRGLYGATNPGQTRLMPEEIFKAASSREEAVNLLRQYAYIF